MDKGPLRKEWVFYSDYEPNLFERNKPDKKSKAAKRLGLDVDDLTRKDHEIILVGQHMDKGPLRKEWVFYSDYEPNLFERNKPDKKSKAAKRLGLDVDDLTRKDHEIILVGQRNRKAPVKGLFLFSMG